MTTTSSADRVADAGAVPPEDDTGGRSRTRRLLIVGAAVLVVVGLGTWLVAFSSVFGVRSVQVHGTHTLSAQQVKDAARVSHGTPLLRLDTGAVAARVERLPDVASARVTTSFPSTVVITVVERTPVGYVRIGGHDMLVDRTGDQYRRVQKAPSGLPKFVVPAGVDARTTGGAVATVASALTPALLAKVSSIEALDPVAITLVLRSDRVVEWGSAARSADKARILPVLLKQKHDQQIDVSDPDQPFTR